MQTPGFVMGRVGYSDSTFSADLYDFGFINIANAYWLDSQYTLRRVHFKPFVQLHAGDEVNAGSSVVGKIDSQVYGILGGLNLNKNTVVSVPYDDIPIKSATVLLPAGVTCDSAHVRIRENPIAGVFFTQRRHRKLHPERWQYRDGLRWRLGLSI